jgi:hypothetical protein
MTAKPTIETVEIDSMDFVEGDKILKLAPIYSKGAKNTRGLVKLKKISEDMFIYAKKDKSAKWIKSDGKSSKFDKVLLKREFADTIPELNKKDGDVIVDKDGVQEAPPVIELEDNEKFRDSEGKIVEIEARGERKIDGVYFKVRHASTAFGMDRLQDVLIAKRSGYEEGIDFVYFFVKNDFPISDGKKKTKTKYFEQIKKEVYLTYRGMLRVLFASTSKKTNQFLKWATETLFTAQMGEKEEKEDLAANLLGISPKTLRDVFSKGSSCMPCVYIFLLGVCKDLRKKMNIPKEIPDDYLIIKYGYTADMVERIRKHVKTYNSIKGVNIELMVYSYVDPIYLSQAEVDIKQYFSEIEKKIEYKNFDELVAVNPKHETQMKKMMKNINRDYSGRVAEFSKQIEKLTEKLTAKDLKIENLQKIHTLEIDNLQKIHTLELEKDRIELGKKDVELENKDLKLKLFQLQKNKL